MISSGVKNLIRPRAVSIASLTEGGKRNKRKERGKNKRVREERKQESNVVKKGSEHATDERK